MKYQIMQSFLYARSEFAELDQETKAEFATLRAHAEKLYTQIHGETAVIPLSEIYRELLRFRAADEKFTELLVTLEEEADQIMQVLPKVDEDLLRPLEREIYKRRDLFSRLSVMASQSARTGRKSVATVMGGILGGYLFFPYVKWIIDKSRKLGIRRLYFVARDGYILKRIAQQIIVNIAGIEIETKYIYGSRRAWRLPVTREGYASYIDWTYVTDAKNLSDLARILDVPVGWLEEALPEEYKEKRGYTEKDKSAVKALLLNDERYMERVLQRFSVKREKAREYLAQNIDISDEYYAFVELGGSGYTMGYMAELMGNLQKPFYAFYFRMDAFAPAYKDVRFLNYSMIETGYDDMIELILEALCRAPHGQCTGYQQSGDEIVPVLDNEGKDIIRYGFEEFCNGLDCYVNKLLMLMKVVPATLPSLDLVHEVMDYLLNAPDPEILQFMGDMPFDRTGKGEAATFAPRLSENDLWNCYYNCEVPIHSWYHGACIRYSLLRCTEEERGTGERFRKQKQFDLEEKVREKKREIVLQRAYTRYDFPILPEGSRVVIYGAGKVGREYIKYIDNTSKYKLTAWIDQNFTEYGSEVESIQSGLRKAFDYVVIAIVSPDIAQEIRENLKRTGVSEEQIAWRDPKENDGNM